MHRPEGSIALLVQVAIDDSSPWALSNYSAARSADFSARIEQNPLHHRNTDATPIVVAALVDLAIVITVAATGNVADILSSWRAGESRDEGWKVRSKPSAK